jgi:hypothetical protein
VRSGCGGIIIWPGPGLLHEHQLGEEWSAGIFASKVASDFFWREMR